MEEETQKVDRRRAVQYFQRLMAMIKNLHLAIAFCVLGSLLTSAVEIALPQIMGMAVDSYMAPVHQGQLASRLAGVRELGELYFGLLAVSSVLSIFVGVGLNQIGQRAVQKIRVTLFEHLHRLPILYFDRNPVGRIVTRVANDTGTLAELFTGVISSVLNDFLKFFIIWLALIYVSPKLSLTLLVLAPPLLWTTLWFQRENRDVQRRSRVQLAQINAFLAESLQGLSVIKSFVAENLMSDRFRAKNQTYFDIEMRMINLFATFRPVFGSAAIVALSILTLYGGYQVQTGTLSLGSLVAFIFYLKMLFTPLDNMAEKFNVFQSAAIACERIFDILDTAPEVDPREGAPMEAAQGAIRFEDVRFAYDPEKPVLKGISFAVEPGQSVAIVGATGSGKSTITNLLFRFYRLEDNGSGRILIDDKPIQEWPLHHLRRQFGLVQQELFLFRADIRRNITLFREIQESKLQSALQSSRAIQVVDRYPSGLGHELGERGLQLSQGERQLLSFARALVEDPPIMILDEATASIDSLTESTIQEALEELLKGRTALVIAHRLSTIRRCDLILVLDKGEIIERGTHDELLALDGSYAELYRHQQEAAQRTDLP